MQQEPVEEVNERPQQGPSEDARLDSDEEGTSSGPAASGEESATHDRLAKLRREKRLAMNRESARLRRSRKKELLETLEQKVKELMQENHSYRVANDLLNKKAQALEQELATAKATIASLMPQAAGNIGATANASPRLLPQQAAILSEVRTAAAATATSDANVRRLLEAQRALGAANQSAAAAAAAAATRISPSLQSVASGRGSLGLGSESSMGRVLSQRTAAAVDPAVAARQLGIQMPTGLHQPSFQMNTLPGPRELGLGETRIGGGVPAGLLLDAITSQRGRTTREPAASAVLEALLKQHQQQQNGQGGKKF